MRLNLDYYNKECDFKLKPNEEKIIEYINLNKENFESILKRDLSDEVVLGFSSIRKNLVYSYDFKPNAIVLEIGAHFGEITGALCEKCEKVISTELNKKRAEAIAKRHENMENLEIVVGNFKDINFNEKFDYITLFGILEYAQYIFNTEEPARDLIKYCKNLLKPDGKLLIATDNKFALRSYVGDRDECTGITFDSVTGYKSSKKTYKLGKKKIENILNEVGLNYYKFFYPLPDYKLPSLIFTDKYLPSSSKINGYFPYYNQNSSIFYSEVDAYDTIIKEDTKMFPFFANSYFIETSQIEFKNDTRFVSFNNCRKEEYQLMTKIREKEVEKTSLNEKAKKHIDEMKKNIQDLKQENIEILDEIRDDKIVSKFVDVKLASQIVSDYEKNLEEILKILYKYRDELLKLTVPYQEEKTVIEKYNLKIDKSILTKFHYLKNGYWDMILKNCFIIDDKCVFFDQEWVEDYVPMEFLIYRSIVNVEKIRNKIEEYGLYEKMQIKEFIPIFEQLDSKITEKILDKEMFSFYQRKYNNPIYDNYCLQEKNAELLQKNKEIEEQNQRLEEDVKDKELLKNKINEITNENLELTKTLNNIYQSRSWKVARGLSKIKHTFKKR